jgi:NDP-4-keto-2,6-dideoxyhexose 3-C-methyltransferase
VIKEFNRCRLCGNPHLTDVVDLGAQPLSCVYVAPAEPDPMVSPLQVVRCDTSADSGACGLLQLRHSADVSKMYGTTYGYRSSTSPTMSAHLAAKAHKLAGLVGLKAGDRVLDIGCNDGTLLNSYGRDAGLQRFGIDPSSIKFRDNFDDDIQVAYDFFSAPVARELTGGGKFRAISSVAMFYDLDDPVAFARDIGEMLAPDGLWCVEQAYLPAMLTKMIYDQIMHEHVTYFALRQMDRVCEAAGLRIVDCELNEINGGSFSLLVCHRDAPHVSNTAWLDALRAAEAPLADGSAFETFKMRMQAHRDEVREFLDLARAAGRTVYGYGASTKGNIQLQYCGIRPGDFAAICDKQSMKHGLMTPGTRFDIVSQEAARAAKPEYLYILIWHLRREIILDELAYLEAGGKLVFPLPRLHLVDRDNYKAYLDRPFDDFSFTL